MSVFTWSECGNREITNDRPARRGGGGVTCAVCGKPFAQNANGSYLACCHITDRRGIKHSVYWYRGYVYGAAILVELGMKATKPIDTKSD